MPTTTMATTAITIAATAQLPFRKESAPAGEYIVAREHHADDDDETHRVIVYAAQAGKKRSIYTIVEMATAADMDRMYARICKAMRAVAA